MAKRRANGEGSIRKRKDGRWEGRYTAGHTPEGKAIYRNVLGKTQAEVVEKLRKAIEETKGLDVAKAGQYTLGQWMRVWYENYATIKVRPSSHATYRGIIKNHIDPAIGDIPLTKLTTLDLQKFYRDLLTAGGWSGKSRRRSPRDLARKPCGISIKSSPPLCSWQSTRSSSLTTRRRAALCPGWSETK